MPSSQQFRSPNVLAIDGGGVRGLSSLLILKEIMQRLQPSVRTDSVLLPCQIFDVICGTSTGGLIAIMLGRLRMSVDEAIAHYRDICKTVFGSPKWFGELRSMVLGTPVYDGSTLERCVKRIAAQSDATNHDGEALMNELSAENSNGLDCYTFVVAMRKAQAAAPPQLFKSYAPEDTYRIWESARATTATMGFFDPVKIQAGTAPPITYLDGDLVAINPSKLACQEVQQLFPGQPISCFLSLGTGILNPVQLKGNLFKIADACKELSKNCEAVADEVYEKFRAESEENGSRGTPYFRFSVTTGQEDIEFDEWEQESNLAAYTNGYMGVHEQKVAVDDCVNALKPKVDWILAQRELQ